MRNVVVTMLLVVSSIMFACSGKSSREDANISNDPTNPNEPDNSLPINVGDDAGSENDSGNTAVATDSSVVPNKEPTNQAECIAACEIKYPNAAVHSHELDKTCFFGVCANVCDNLGQGDSKFPDPDAGAACNTVGAGSFPIGTPSQDCSNCLATTTACCDLWIKIFASLEGQNLNQCAHNCWDKFPQ